MTCHEKYTHGERVTWCPNCQASITMAFDAPLKDLTLGELRLMFPCLTKS